MDSVNHVVQLLHLTSTEAALSALRGRLAASPRVLLIEFLGLALFTLLALAGKRWAAVAVVPFALAWPFLNQLVEGPTLVALSYNHGITLMDSLSGVALLAAAYALLHDRHGGSARAARALPQARDAVAPRGPRGA